MKISARNKLKGTIASIEKGAVNSIIKIKLTGDPVLTAVITNEAVMDLGLAVDGQACAVVKASSVLVGVCEEGHSCGCQE